LTNELVHYYISYVKETTKRNYNDESGALEDPRVGEVWKQQKETTTL